MRVGLSGDCGADGIPIAKPLGLCRGVRSESAFANRDASLLKSPSATPRPPNKESSEPTSSSSKESKGE